MQRFELMTVEHAWLLERPGVHMLILSPHFLMPAGWEKKGWRERNESVLVVRPDGTEIEANAQINVTHLNISGLVPLRERWPITIWLTDRNTEEVPVGSKILVSREVRDAILPKITPD